MRLPTWKTFSATITAEEDGHAHSFPVKLRARSLREFRQKVYRKYKEHKITGIWNARFED